MNDSTASDQAKTSEERIEQHLGDLSGTASWLRVSVDGIEDDIRSCISGQVLMMGIASMFFFSCFSLSSGSSCCPVTAAS